MSSIPQTIPELQRHLRDCVGFLERSSVAFDQGYLGEAKRLATTIRVLVHDTRNSSSLLGQLDLKTQILYTDTASPYSPKTLTAQHGLVGIRIGGGQGARYYAPLDDGPREMYGRSIPFDLWWGAIVIHDMRKSSFSRSDLVLTLANKDGGAHVDASLDKKYADLTRGNSIGWEWTFRAETSPLLDVELLSVRQIAYEMLDSLRRVPHLKTLFDSP